MVDKVSSGQRFNTTPVYSAAFQNDLVDMVNWFKTQRGGRWFRPGRTPATDIVQVKNLTGADLALGSAVQLGDSLVDDVGALWFEGNAVAAPVTSKIAIVRDPLPEDSIGPAQLSGACVALIDVTDIDHTHAVAVAGDPVLASAAGGPIEILSPLSTTGEQLVAVLLGGGVPTVQLGITDAAIDKGDTGTVSILTGPLGAETDSGENVAANSPFGDVLGAKEVLIFNTGAGWYIGPSECD